MRYLDISTDFIDKEFFIVLCTTDELISITNKIKGCHVSGTFFIEKRNLIPFFVKILKIFLLKLKNIPYYY